MNGIWPCPRPTCPRARPRRTGCPGPNRCRRPQPGRPGRTARRNFPQPLLAPGNPPMSRPPRPRRSLPDSRPGFRPLRRPGRRLRKRPQRARRPRPSRPRRLPRPCR